MYGGQRQEEALIRNLQDAGCPQAVIEQFMESYTSNNTVAQICILSMQRRRLLDSVHKEQGKLDCLDHLLFQLRKNVQEASDTAQPPRNFKPQRR